MQINVNKVKIAVMVPSDYSNKIRDCLTNNGIGHIGNYDKCLTITHCLSTFAPNAKAHPFMGKTNEMSIVKEDKIEFVCNIGEVEKIIKLIKDNHPYEEVGIDVYPLINIEDIK